jgi:hypothetical protein
MDRAAKNMDTFIQSMQGMYGMGVDWEYVDTVACDIAAAFDIPPQYVNASLKSVLDTDYKLVRRSRVRLPAKHRSAGRIQAKRKPIRNRQVWIQERKRIEYRSHAHRLYTYNGQFLYFYTPWEYSYNRIVWYDKYSDKTFIDTFRAKIKPEKYSYVNAILSEKPVAFYTF